MYTEIQHIILTLTLTLKYKPKINAYLSSDPTTLSQYTYWQTEKEREILEF